MPPKKETKDDPKKNRRQAKAADKSKVKKDAKSKSPAKSKSIQKFSYTLR